MSTDIDINKLRNNYQTVMLNKQIAKKNPFAQFQLWFDEVLASELSEPNAMNLATVSKEGEVSSRMVLLKTFDETGFVFFTNYNSSKAQDIQSTKNAAINFWWDMLYRQVRIDGRVEKIPREDSVEYFHSRPVGSQIGAIASQQSRVIKNYTALEKEYQRLEQYYKNQEIPCPEHWGGYRVIPKLFEFWQGRPNRLHDRLRYTQTSTEAWSIERLSP
ncbi:MAG: pyridoxamine 5'-phosphate oxidase [Gammaproteobacteria bacterium]|jgi:pyridoxamine 5'-phosphate oxidase|nr:pyridoxamine 5'-phosphate oxidase [Gammaproteobacteria bacterium]